MYRYRFNWEAPVRRACHALDLPFTFGALDVSTWRAFAGAEGDTRADALSTRMQQAWTSFAADATPSDDTIGVWPDAELVGLGVDATIGDDAISARLRVWLGE